MVLTYNEEPNIGRALEGLRWASQILVLDSFSTDRTLEIAGAFPQVRILQRKFDTFAGQCNFSLGQVSTPWVLSLDADYIIPEGFSAEVAGLDTEMAGYEATFRYCVYGRPLRASLYPSRTVLYRVGAARYEDDGHTQRVHMTGAVGRLKTSINHDDRKSFSRWLASQDGYALREADKLLLANPKRLPLQDRLRRLILPAPFVAFFYTLLVKGVFLDGWAGWFYAWQRMAAETILSLRLLDKKLEARRKASGS